MDEKTRDAIARLKATADGVSGVHLPALNASDIHTVLAWIKDEPNRIYWATRAGEATGKDTAKELIREQALRLVSKGRGNEAVIWYEAAESAVPSTPVDDIDEIE